MSIVAIGDIGVLDGMMHIGDEAMFEAFLDAARARGIRDVVAISANPAESTARYGISAIGRIGFTGTRAQMSERLAAVIAAAGSRGSADGEQSVLTPDDPALAVITAIAASDLVVVTGAGNIASNWPLHIFERAAIAEIARLADVPFVVSGQTIGPSLNPDDAALGRQLLGSARLVGLRESASFELVRGLDSGQDTGHDVGHDAWHAAIEQTVDDASFLDIDSAVVPSRSTCLVSFSTHVGDRDRDAFQDAAALLLDDMAALGLEIVFHAHFGPLAGEPTRGDVVMHEAVASRMKAPSRTEPTIDPRTSASLARGAALVVTSRYHPAVFAVGAGVPTIGIAVDEYTNVKLTGALGNLGQDGVLTADELLEGEGAAMLSRVWADREPTRTRGLSLATERRRDSERWWDRVFGSAR
ncbi:MAG: polysaccharide pyruvyl transferase family protein [Salinibacterium sp.]|nr:polysaccharide pyruvyl transferase family protein [Salinibacterium sp.]